MSGLTGAKVETEAVSLSRQPSFLKLWASESISSLGAQFSELAIPLTAVLVLNGSPEVLGILTASITAPFLLFSLVAGVWVDRHRRKSVMVLSNIGRVLVLTMVPLAAIAGLLSIPLLLGAAFLVGSLRVFFDIAYQSYLPEIVWQEQLVDANSRLEGSRAVSSVAGPGIAGAVIGAIGVPFAIAFDSISFLFSTIILGRIPGSEPVKLETERPSAFSEIRNGLEVVGKDPLLRALAASGATANFFEFAVQAIFLLYAVNDLGLGPTEVGLILSLGAVGAVVGAVVAGWLARKIGIGPAITASLVLGVAAWGPLIYFADRTTGFPFLIAAWFCGEVSFVAWTINQSSLRQAMCPARLMGRMNATFRFLTAGAVPIGSIVGGLLGELLGVRSAIGLSALGLIVAPLFIVLSPVPRLKKLAGLSIAPGPV